MKKDAAKVIWFVVIILLCCSSCGIHKQTETAADDIIAFSTAKNKDCVITVRTEPNIADTYMKSALEAEFPAIDFVFVQHCAKETQYELRKSLLSGNAEDIILSPHLATINDIAENTLYDFSGNELISSYNENALASCAVGGKVFYLPGFSDIYAIVYDKTLFEKNGWKVPHSYDSFIALCRKIDDAGLRAIQPTCLYARQTQLMFTMFCFNDVFAGIDSYEWLSRYQNGTAKMNSRLLPAFEKYQDLKKNGIIRSSDFDLAPGNRSIMMYSKHTCAMIIENQMAEIYGRTFHITDNSQIHNYGMMPFWCGNGKDDDHVLSYANYYIGINKKLSSPENKAKLKQVLRVISYISTPEGQRALSGGKITMASNVRNTVMDETPFNKEIIDTLKKGNAVLELNLMVQGNNNPAEKALQKGLKEYLNGTQTAEQVMSACDEARDNALAKGTQLGKVYGAAEENFTRVETGMLVADALRLYAHTDIALCLTGTYCRGIEGCIYKGDITDKDIEILYLSNGPKSTVENDKKLWVIEMKGNEIAPFIESAGTNQLFEKTSYPVYFVPSGLKMKFKPWAPAGSRVTELTAADGTALDAQKTYTVALWAWPFEAPCPYHVAGTYDIPDSEILSSYIEAKKTVSPARDGRMTFVRR